MEVGLAGATWLNEAKGVFKFHCEHGKDAVGTIREGKVEKAFCASGCCPESLQALLVAASESRADGSGGERQAVRPSPHHNGNGKGDGLYPKLKAEIERDPVASYQAILSQTLRTKAGSREMFALCPFHNDSNPSLRVNLDKGGLWRCDPCGKGGTVFTVAEMMAGSFADGLTLLSERLRVWPNGNGHANGKAKSTADRKEVRRLRYEVRDIEGNLKATHIRIEYDDGSKNMPWEPPGTKPSELPLYGLGRLTEASSGDPVIVCEGEKKSDSLVERNHLAVGTVTGAGGLPCDDALRALVPFAVYLWPDNDEKGAEHMKRVAEKLIDLGASRVFMIEWADAPPKGDAADFTGDIQSLLDAAEPYRGEDPPLRPIGLGALYDLVDEFDRQPWVWEGILPQSSLSLIVGKSETGKSTLLYRLIAAVVRGQEFLGRQCTRGRVLYLAGDPVSEIVAGKTLRQLGLGRDDEVQVVPGALVAQKDGLEYLRKWVKDFRPVLVVGDTLAATLEIDVDKYGQSYQVQQPLTRLARDFKPNFLMSHHSQKSAIDTYSVIDSALGSVGVAAVASTRMATKMYQKHGKKFYTFAMSNSRIGVGLEGEWIVNLCEDGHIELEGLWGKRTLAMDTESILKALGRQEAPIAERTLWGEIFPKPKWADFKKALIDLVESRKVDCRNRTKSGGGRLYSMGSDQSSLYNGN